MSKNRYKEMGVGGGYTEKVRESIVKKCDPEVYKERDEKRCS
jgi:hypothetical protein